MILGCDMQTHSDQSERIFKLALRCKNPVGQRLFSHLAPPLESIVALRAMEQIYASVRKEEDPVRFIEAVFSILETRVDITERDLARIPKQGPAIAVANHPFGGIEGLALIWLLRLVRPDVKVMANFLLGRIPQLRDSFILVDPFGRPESSRANIRGLREAIRWVEEGDMLAIFPSGTVSHLHLRSLQVTDPKWSGTIARLFRHTKASALPVYFAGCNGPLFQMLGLAHPLLRTVMLPREMVNKRGRVIEARVGDPIPSRKLCAYTDDEMVDLLRDRTYLLGMRARSQATPARRSIRRPKVAQLEPLVEAEPAEVLAEEVRSLPEEQILVESKEHLVCYARANQIPHLLREIGRLREYTFRGAGEGTGKALDIDAFDEYYLHLFVWNREKQEIMGAYRLGRTDEILPRHGLGGLYTQTLFRYHRELFNLMGPALEMGRSFVRPEYQRSYAGLLLLWRGIGEYVCRHPDCKTLFGPVSISNGYQVISRQLIVAYLRQVEQMHPWSRFVRPRNPFQRAKPGLRRRALTYSALEDAADIDGISEVISHIEEDQKGVPILLKNYLKLGACPLGFNVDPDFSDVLDVLVLVDLSKTDPKLLERYMGKDGAAGFLEYHGRRGAAA